MNFKIIGEWDNDLIWCPSQLLLKIERENVVYQIYCRWRWSDPWTVSLIDPADKRLFKKDLKSTQDTPLEEVHCEALEEVNRFFERKSNENDKTESI